MAGEGGTIHDRTLTEVAMAMRSLLTAINTGRLTCLPAARYRLEGMVTALEAMTAPPGKGPA